jgi:hypothetical protein
VFEQVDRQEQSAVAVADSQASAQLLVAALQVQGIDATSMIASAIPSLDWVQGFAVLVPAEHLEGARTILADLGHEPIGPERR